MSNKGGDEVQVCCGNICICHRFWEDGEAAVRVLLFHHLLSLEEVLHALQAIGYSRNRFNFLKLCISINKTKIMHKRWKRKREREKGIQNKNKTYLSQYGLVHDNGNQYACSKRKHVVPFVVELLHEAYH